MALPLRVGYGELAHLADPEAHGSCNSPDFAGAQEQAARQILAVVAHLQARADIDPGVLVLAGHSFGAMASLTAAAHRPPGLRAVVSLAGC